mmetsp:Transcript_88675/g.177304  ORF Transcript_88675/g.177304 Transcript_88675/m.177304 type:complete len:395 (+) Transcript_88675:300-1484(+)
MRCLRMALFLYAPACRAFDLTSAQFAARFAFEAYDNSAPTPLPSPLPQSYPGAPLVFWFDGNLPQVPLPELRCNHDASSCRRLAFIDVAETDTQADIWKRKKDDGGEEIVVAFRGTELLSRMDVLTDLLAVQRSLDCSFLDNRTNGSGKCPGDVKAHAGFLRAYLSIRYPLQQVLSELGVFRHAGASNTTISPSVMVCGHSLGGALALLCSLDLSMPTSIISGSNGQLGGGGEFEGLNQDQLSVYTFGCPRVGNRAFAKEMSRIKPFRFSTANDIIPRLPRGSVVNRIFDYSHPAPATIFLRPFTPPDGSEIQDSDLLDEEDPGYKGVFPLDIRDWRPFPLRASFVRAELRIFKTLLTGSAIKDHFRDSYLRGLGLSRSQNRKTEKNMTSAFAT